MADQTHNFFGRCYEPTADSPQRSIPLRRSPQATLVLKFDDVFLTTDHLGNTLGASDPTHTGLFCRDTRFLSQSQLTLNGRSPQLQNYDASRGDEAIITYVYPSENEEQGKTVEIQRHLILCGGLFERITLINHQATPISLSIQLAFDADFLDLFEVRRYCDRPQRGQTLRLAEPSRGLRFAYCGLDGALVESVIEFQGQFPNEISDQTATWNLTLAPQVCQSFGYRLTLLTDDQLATQTQPPDSFEMAQERVQKTWEAWKNQTTQISSDNPKINGVLARSQRDIYLLRQSFGEETVLSAGIPWFSTLFGRDSAIAASQTLLIAPHLARDTAISLGRHQGTLDSDWHDEDPGKILHEVRVGEMARCGEIPHTPYYGTIDATPLWLLLLADYYAWTADQETLHQLWPNVLAAMDWIDRQVQPTGYLTYLRRSPGGIRNQGWKDSGDCIVDGNGKQVDGAIALCEVQAYVYAAKTRWSELAEMFRRPDLQQQWREDAEQLKQRFNKDFWLSEAKYCALALTEDGHPIDSITSNPGLCLFADIFDPDKAQAVARRLKQPDLYSGWGIRTLSCDSPAYEADGYHIGSVWPHDTAAIAVGLRHIGESDFALTLAGNLFEMAQQQPELRPSELFCGNSRQDNRPVIPYPVACSPQAWASGCLFQLIQMALNLQPDAANRQLHLHDPRLLPHCERLELRGVQVGDASVDLVLEQMQGQPKLEVLNCHGDLTVAIAP
ncbi:MAG: glycogen debranching N-terminal domain-containing protein [Phormidium sp.]|nr:MAG: Glycogen debranching enzyme [Phormidium sp. OSCR]